MPSPTMSKESVGSGEGNAMMVDQAESDPLSGGAASSSYAANYGNVAGSNQDAYATRVGHVAAEDLESGYSLLSDRERDPDNRRYAGFLGFLLSKVEVCPTMVELETAREIRGMVGAKFNPDDPRHVEDLKQLWRFIYPHKDVPDIPSEEWKSIGFQGKNPATDFRGGGILSLYAMMYLAEKYPDKTRDMIQRSNDDSSTYLWACACINVVMQLLFYLKLNTDEMSYQGVMRPAPIGTQKEVLRVMSTGTMTARDAFCEMFAQSMMKLHDVWLNMSRKPEVTMLNFGEALGLELEALRVTCARAASYVTLNDFSSIMAIDPDSWGTKWTNWWNDFSSGVSESCSGAILGCMNMGSSRKYPKRKI